MTDMEKKVLQERLGKLSTEQLKAQIEKTQKEVSRLEKLELTYREINEKDPHLKKYNLQNYRIWQNTINSINKLKEALEIGKQLLKDGE